MKTKRERHIRIQYAETLSDFTNQKLCPLLCEVEKMVNDSKDEGEKERLQRRFDQINKMIHDVFDEIDSVTEEPRIVKPKLTIVRNS